jgi:hypothetical protein
MYPADQIPSSAFTIGPYQPAGRETPPAPTSLPPLLWGIDSLVTDATASPRWLWHGYLAPGAVTLLTSRWKSGKTTLAAVLLAKLGVGGQLAGLPLAAGKAVVVSEESRDLWYRRHQKLNFGDHLGWICRPFPGKPRLDEWHSFIDQLAALSDQRGLNLAVIDPLASFLPARNENNASSMLEALTPLQRLTNRGLSVLVMHHPSKDDPPIGQAARGSGALSGYVDILMEMRFCPNAPDDDRRRRLYAFSRFDDTPRQRLIELTADGTDYLSHGTFEEDDFATQWQTVQAILAAAPGALSRADIRRFWPHAQVPDATTICRWLERAVALGLVCKDGRGLRNHPFRYRLPES